MTKPNKALAQKIVSYLGENGLTSGLGDPEPGKMCVEAMICHLMGLDHDDDPPCVGSGVRNFKIRLNDCDWSSNKARAEGMKKLAVAQLGSNEIDQTEFSKLVFLRGTQKLLPMVFRKVAEDKEVKDEHRAGFIEHAGKCEAVKTYAEAKRAAKDASASASAYASAYASASASAYAYASASAYAYASASASAYASWLKGTFGDSLLIATAEVGLSVLIEMKSPGCKWLNLFEK